MRKITFDVSSKKEASVKSLIKEVNKISCRIQIDLKNSFVTVENVEDAMIDTVIDLVEQYYTISSVNIDNISDEAAVVETSQNNTAVDRTKTEDKKNSNPENNSTVVGPQSEDDLIIQKVEFRNKYVEEVINRLIKTSYWAMYKTNVSENEIGDFIWSSIREISMKYSKNEKVEYSIGDIVSCDYGMHLPGETSGSRVYAIVCNITGTNMAYLVPITIVRKDLDPTSCIIFDVSKDIVCTKKNYLYSGMSVLLNEGCYLRAERINEVVAKTTPEFFAKVLKQLSTTFNFTGNTVTNNDTQPKSNTEQNIQKVGIEETALMNVIGDALKKLDPNKSPRNQIEAFLTDIGMVTDRMVLQSFLISCNIPKIKYENIILELHDMFNVKESIIKANLKDNFKKWLDANPDLVKNCPKVSFTTVLKMFAKRFA